MDQLGREKIISLLQETILSLCQKNYKGSVEVDGIICITSLCSTDQHVVKIHQTLNSYDDTQYNQEQITLDLHVEDEASSHISSGDRIIFGKKKRGRSSTQKLVKEKKKQKETIEHSNAKKNDEAALNNIDKYPYLMQTLCGSQAEAVRPQTEILRSQTSWGTPDETMRSQTLWGTDDETVRSQTEILKSNQGKMFTESEDSNNSDYLLPNAAYCSSREVTPVRELGQVLDNKSNVSGNGAGGSHTNERSKKFDSFWKAILKKRLQEKEKVAVKQEPEEPRNMAEQVVTKDLMDTIIDSHMSPNPVVPEQTFPRDSSTENSYDGYIDRESENGGKDFTNPNGMSNLDNNLNVETPEDTTGKVYTTVVPEGMFIKEEPVWEDGYSESSSQSKTNHSSHDFRGPDSLVNMSPLAKDSSVGIAENNIKREVDICDGTGVGHSMDDQQLVESNKNSSTDDQQRVKSNKNSILLKILKGKSLKEAYRYTNRSGVSTVTSTDHQINSSLASHSSTQDNSEKKDNPNDQDNSLLYRLPFVSFQDLFSPIPNSTPFPPMDTNNSASRLKTCSATKNSTFEALARTLLETKDDSARSKRLSSSKQISLADYEYGSEVDSEDPEDIEIEDDPYDSSYIPYKDEEEEPPSRKKMKKRKVRKSNPKFSGGSSKRKRAEYTCGLCGQKFDSIGERNRHEERELQDRGLDQPEFVKCPLCNGYFADEPSRNKHLTDRHNIAPSQVLQY